MENLKALGKASKQPQRPEDAELERVPNPHPDTNFVARFTQPEFTSLCPVTAQPDFAHLVIDYVPDQWMVESKSLKLYFNSFRNHQSFHEACTVGIGKQLVALLTPRWLRIGGYWYPRGGMPIDVFWQFGEVPAGTWVVLSHALAGGKRVVPTLRIRFLPGVVLPSRKSNDARLGLCQSLRSRPCEARRS